MNSDTTWFLVSLYDKPKYVDWIRAIDDLKAYKFLGTEGTADWCKKRGVECATIGDVIGLDPRLGGKVKSLHPDLYTGIMADSREDLPAGIPYIGGVCVDLTPFRQNGDFKPGKIDIGGPSLLRASAKSWESVVVVCDSDTAEYHRVNSPASESDRKYLARKAFRRTLRYDKKLLPEFDESVETDTPAESLTISPVNHLRYGENPSQSGYFAQDLFGSESLPYIRLTGDELSFTNFLDAESARRLAVADDELQVSVIKHTNPTGWARGSDPAQVIENAWEGDPKSAFGSVIGINQTVTSAMIDAMSDYFVEGIVAPEFTDSARHDLQEDTTRALEWDREWDAMSTYQVKSVSEGYLVQSNPRSIESPGNWRTVSSVSPGENLIRAMQENWRICRWVTSNAAVIGTDDRILGVGAGQQSRVDAVQLAVDKFKAFHDSVNEPIVLASDGFFPFPDNIDVAAEAGVEAIVSPGGSVRDDEVIEAADNHGIAMMFTDSRAFYH